MDRKNESIEMNQEDFKKKIQTVREDLEKELDSRLAMSIYGINRLRIIMDIHLSQSNQNPIVPISISISFHALEASEIKGIKIGKDNDKLLNILVIVEKTQNNEILVKVGPHDLSAVGGHKVREQMIRNVVNQALEQQIKEKKLPETLNYENVNVSAVIGVRGPTLMLQDFFNIKKSFRQRYGNHKCIYIKRSHEKEMTHIDPVTVQEGIDCCALMSLALSSLFEKIVREDRALSSVKLCDWALSGRGSKLLKNMALELEKRKDGKSRLAYLLNQTENMYGNIKEELCVPEKENNNNIKIEINHPNEQVKLRLKNIKNDKDDKSDKDDDCKTSNLML